MILDHLSNKYRPWIAVAGATIILTFNNCGGSNEQYSAPTEIADNPPTSAVTQTYPTQTSVTSPVRNNTPIAGTSGSGPSSTPHLASLGNTITEKTYDVNCIDNVLGKQRTDDIVYRGHLPAEEEVKDIEHCKLFGDINNSAQIQKVDKTEIANSKTETVIQPKSKVDERNHDIGCVANALGAEATYAIVYEGKPATNEQLY